jgi:thioredoxin-like negative regulator of GroEL
MQRSVVALLVLAACSNEAGSAPANQAPPAKAAAKPADGQYDPTADPCGRAKREGAMWWIDDDYPSALACAKHRKQPLVIDFWAPWCHTCLSMKSTVFTDPSFVNDAKRFVFASIDTERDDNAPVVAKFPLSAWPTFYVIGPDEAVLSRHFGAASVEQFHAFLEAGATAASGAAGDQQDALLLEAERATAAKDYKTADAKLEAALRAAPMTWSRRPEALVALIRTKRQLKDVQGCLALAEKQMDATGDTASATDFIVFAMSCADDRAMDEAPRVTKFRERAVARLNEVLAKASLNPPGRGGVKLSYDDRSDAMGTMRELYEALDKKAQAKAIAEAQRKLLDEAAAKAPDAKAASTYNPHRAEVYAYLGRPLDLVPDLQKSVAALPGDYDPKIRLAWIYMKGGKLDDAARWADEALRQVYGPRRVRVLTIRAEIAGKQGGKSAERPYREQIVKFLEGLPPGQAQPDALAAAKKTLADLDAASKP